MREIETEVEKVEKEKKYPDVEILEDSNGNTFAAYHILEPQWLNGHTALGLAVLPWRTQFITYAMVECLWRDKDMEEGERKFPGWYKIPREQFLSVKPTCDISKNGKKTVPLAHFLISELRKAEFPKLDWSTQLKNYQQKLDPKVSEEIKNALQKLREGKKVHHSAHSLTDDIWKE